MTLQTFISRVVAFLPSLQTLSSPPRGRARSITSFFIAAYLFWQLALPLHYYLREDQSDERFAWRMFSAVNYLQRTCIVSLGEWRPDGQLRPLVTTEFVKTVPAGWMHLLHRDRAEVIDKFLRRHCQANPALSAVELLRKCDTPDRTGKTLESFKMTCLTGELKRTRESP